MHSLVLARVRYARPSKGAVYGSKRKHCEELAQNE